MRRIRFVLACAVMLWATLAAAQDRASGAVAGRGRQAKAPATQDRAPNAAPRKQANAERVDGGTIRIDGRLDEEAWLRAEPIIDFIQKEPVEGAPPTDRMEVRFLYDEDALYVGAQMFTRSDARLQAPLGRRDNVGQAEHFLVSLDTFLDRRTAYTFGVTAGGVRLDRFHPTDNEDNFDAGFDPVWEAKTSRSADGWTAELWIPFSQLRFTPQAEQVWGLNVRRFRPTLDEEDYWVLVPRTERVWTSRFGDLRGISGARPTRRIELLPYVAGASTVQASRDARNPFDSSLNLASRGGLDMKMGLGPNLTLEATVNPDFGQVEADPAEVNLTAFETRFPEKRPFFTEGTRLLNVNNPNFFYSRRIGARPIGAAAGDFVDYPKASTIIAAAKLTGRLPSKTSVGMLSAVTEEESARIFNLGAPGITSVHVAPRTMYGLARVQQEFGQLASTASVLATAVHRNLADGDPLANVFARNAFALAGDALLRFKGGEYELRSSGGATFVNGEPKAIERIQRTSSHFAQRPDKTYAQLDPTLTSLSGYSFETRLERTGGRHWIGNAGIKVDSPRFESNDIGLLNSGDGIMPTFDVRYRETRPGKIFRFYSIGLNGSNEWSFGGYHQTASFRPSVNLTWRNYWTTSWTVTRTLRTQDSALTRGGPLMQRPRGWSSNVSLGNRSTSQTRWSGTFVAGGNEDGGRTRRASGSFSFRPGPRWQLSAEPFYERLTEAQQYVTTVAGGRPETFGSRYVFAYIERSTLSMEYRLGLTVKPDVNLDLYAEPFAASGRYYDFGELLAPRVRERLVYGTTGTTIAHQADGAHLVTPGASSFTIATRDFNVRSFRSNIVLRWEWRPGSTLYVVWQQDRLASEVLGTRVGLGDMFRSFAAPGANYFVVKTSFWLPVK